MSLLPLITLQIFHKMEDLQGESVHSPSTITFSPLSRARQQIIELKECCEPRKLPIAAEQAMAASLTNAKAAQMAMTLNVLRGARKSVKNHRVLEITERS